MFNTLPSNAVADPSSAAVSSSGGQIPTITPRGLGAASFAFERNGTYLEGFVGDGDYVRLPPGPTSSLEYYNAAGALQWSVTRANINAAVDVWAGFHFDVTDGLVYMVGVDQGTTPNTYYTASIAVGGLGTLVNIGSAQPATDFTTATGNYWNISPTSTGSTTLYRELDGSGNLFITSTNGAGVQEMEINITTGAIVSDPAVVPADGQGIYTCIKLPNGLYFSSPATATSGETQVELLEPSRTYPQLKIAQGGGVTQSNAIKLIKWKGYVAAASVNSASVLGPRWWNTTNMVAFTNAIRGLF